MDFTVYLLKNSPDTLGIRFGLNPQRHKAVLNFERVNIDVATRRSTRHVVAVSPPERCSRRVEVDKAITDSRIMISATEDPEVQEPRDSESNESAQPNADVESRALNDQDRNANRKNLPRDQVVEKPHASPGLLSRLATWGTAGIGIQVLLTLVGFLHPLLELAAHFSMHSLVFCLVFLPLLVWRGRKRSAASVALSFAALLFIVQPWLLLPGSRSGQSSTVGEALASRGSASNMPACSVKVMSWNVLTTNHAFADVEALVAQQDPDVLVLIEVRPNFLQELPQITSEYPYQEVRPSWGGEGMAILSKVPIESFEWQDFGYAVQPALVATLRKSDVLGSETESNQDDRLRLVGLHTLSPVPVHRARTRNTQLSLLAEWSQTQSGPICVCGDFNITPWTAPFQSLLRVGFVDSRIGSENGASWPSPLGWLGIPIDHAVTKGECQISDRSILAESPGSDHKPLVFTVTF